MSWYADSQRELSEGDDYGDKECPECDGRTRKCMNCEKAISEDEICDCEYTISYACPECNGSGRIPKTAEDITDEE